MADSQRKPMAFLPEAHTDFVILSVPESRWLAAIFAACGCLALLWWRRRRVR